MKLLLFLLGVVFFLIFFLFSRLGNIEGFFITNLFWIANIYIGISLIFIISLISKPSTADKQESESESEIKETYAKYLPTKTELGKFIKDFFSNYLYYIACTLFYLALYLIIRALYGQINASVLFLFLNAIVIGLYFLEHKFTLFQDFVRVNLVLISLYYIVKHFLYVIGFSYEFTIIDIINIVGVFILFFILLSSSRVKKYRKILCDYCIMFSFLEISTFYKSFFGGELFSIGIISGTIGALALIYTSQIYHIFSFTKEKIRGWGVFFLCLFIAISMLYIGKEQGQTLFLIPLLWGASYLFYMFHTYFQNYVALAFGSLGIVAGSYGSYSILLSETSEKYYIHFFFIIFSWAFLFFDRFFENKSLYDKYFFHILSLLVNALGVFCFFFFYDISILHVGILLLVESLYLFFSYYTISHFKKIG